MTLLALADGRWHKFGPVTQRKLHDFEQNSPELDIRYARKVLEQSTRTTRRIYRNLDGLIGIGQGCAQNGLSIKQRALAQMLPNVFACGGALLKKGHPQTHQCIRSMSDARRQHPATHATLDSKTLLTRVSVSSGRALAISGLVVALPRRVFHFRRTEPVSFAENCSGLSLFFLAGVGHNEAKHCEQCRKHTRAHKSCSRRRGGRSVPTCVFFHEAQVPARHRRQ